MHTIGVTVGESAVPCLAAYPAVRATSQATSRVTPHGISVIEAEPMVAPPPLASSHSWVPTAIA